MGYENSEGAESVREYREEDFAVADCALAALATGRRALNLRELREILLSITLDSIYFHFWGNLLRPRFDDPEYHNDFAQWARYGLNDPILAERLGAIDPADYSNLELLRQELIDVIEERLDQSEMIPWAKYDNQFHFIRSQMVVFDTHRILRRPEELADAVPELSLGSIFFHVIDARRRTKEGVDDFRAWLVDFEGYEELCEELSRLDPYFSGLSHLRNQLTRIFRSYFRR